MLHVCSWAPIGRHSRSNSQEGCRGQAGAGWRVGCPRGPRYGPSSGYGICVSGAALSGGVGRAVMGSSGRCRRPGARLVVAARCPMAGAKTENHRRAGALAVVRWGGAGQRGSALSDVVRGMRAAMASAAWRAISVSTLV